MNLAIGLVTRGRPQRLIETIERTLLVMAEASTRIIVAVDDDDEPTQQVRSQLEQYDRVTVDSRPREDALGAKWDRVLDYPADVFLPQADYTPYVTPAFDTKIL